jgi:hypothetical protein
MIKVLFHAGREADIHKFRKPFHQQIVDHDAEFCWSKLAVSFMDILSVLNG